jgi:hypothetical protein
MSAQLELQRTNLDVLQRSVFGSVRWTSIRDDGQMRYRCRSWGHLDWRSIHTCGRVSMPFVRLAHVWTNPSLRFQALERRPRNQRAEPRRFSTIGGDQAIRGYEKTPCKSRGRRYSLTPYLADCSAGVSTLRSSEPRRLPGFTGPFSLNHSDKAGIQLLLGIVEGPPNECQVRLSDLRKAEDCSNRNADRISPQQDRE